MKNDRKSTMPIIAARSGENKNQKPAPPANGNGAASKARVSRLSQQAAERMKSIVLERIGDGIIGFDADMNHVYVNEQAGELLGRKPADLVGKNFWQEYPEAADTSFAEACQRALETQSLTQFDGYFPPTDNWLRGSIHPSNDGLSILFTDGARHQQAAIEHARTEENLRESQERLRLAAQAAQALERARAEHSLRESEERYRNLFNLVPVAVYSCDADGRIQEFNHRSVELWGREPGKNDPQEKYCGSFKIFYPDGRFMPHEECPMARMLAGETLEQRELEILVERPDGSRRNVIAHPLPLKNERGEIISAINCLYDITERKQLEDELLAGRQRLSATYEHAPIGIVEVSLAGRHIKVNEEFSRILGYEKDELLELGIKDLTYEQDYPLEEARYRQLVLGDIPFYKIEKRYNRRDGALIWVQITRSAVRNAHGKTLYTIGAVIDISDRKQAEQTLRRLNLELEERVQMRTAQLQSANESLRESEATSRLILESMPDAIVITDGEGRIVHCNVQVEKLFGYSPNDVLGQTVEMLIPKNFRDQHINHRQSNEERRYRRIMGLGRELFGLRKDHSEFPVDVMLSPMSGNTAWDVLVTIRDNTEQKQAQNALRASEEKLRTLFEILPVGISFLDKNARITEMNSALAAILGVPKQDLLKGSFKSRRYIHPDGTPMPPTEFASTRAITEQKTIYNIETGIVNEKDEITWTNVNAAPVDVADVKAVVVTADISKRRQAEEALRQNRERLRHLSRRLVEVQEEERRAIARELHDRVGQNLAALNLNLNILRSQISEQSLKQIGTRLDDSVNMVKELLTITRSVMNDLRSNVLDDYGLVSALSEYADKFTQRYGIQVITEPQAQPIPRLDPGIEMTLLRIAQEALTNVARHAHASNVTLAINVENNTVNMTIQDNGSGILSWQKANQPGSHGLRIIRERAEAFGGLLHVHSSYQKGTRIEVRIPLTNGNQNKVLREKRS